MHSVGNTTWWLKPSPWIESTWEIFVIAIFTMLIIICEFCYSEVTLEGQNERKKRRFKWKAKKKCSQNYHPVNVSEIFLKSIPLFEPHLSANTIQSK